MEEFNVHAMFLQKKEKVQAIRTAGAGYAPVQQRSSQYFNNLPMSNQTASAPVPTSIQSGKRNPSLRLSLISARCVLWRAIVQPGPPYVRWIYR
jgi:hypothetical protein